MSQARIQDIGGVLLRINWYANPYMCHNYVYKSNMHLLKLFVVQFKEGHVQFLEVHNTFVNMMMAQSDLWQNWFNLVI